MKVMWKRIGDLAIRLECRDEQTADIVHRMFGERPALMESETPDFYRLTICQGGEPNRDGTDTTISRDHQGAWIYDRPDYRLRISPDCLEADIRFYDYIGLRCVMMNWYSAVAAYLNWGLVVHSSCVIHRDEAYLFAGYSGAGKTTVAALSHPRALLSDEASLVKLSPNHPAFVYDSPMRSSLFEPAPVESAPLRAIYLLQQSLSIRKSRISASEAFLSLLDKIWYWPCQPAQAVQVIRLCKLLTEQVPVYRLEFQKNDLFWEAIS